MNLILVGYDELKNVPRDAYRYDLNHEVVRDVSALHPQKLYDQFKEILQLIYDEDLTWNWAIVLLSANPHLFDMVGNMIARGQMHFDEWGIEVSYYGENATVINTTYDREGFVLDWPYGLFDVELD